MGTTGGVARSLEDLPARYRGAPGIPPTRYRLTVGSEARDVIVNNGSCRVEIPGDRADVEITTDPRTWRAIDGGRISGIEAFATRKLFVRGSIERSLLFETLFNRPRAGALGYSIDVVGTRKTRFSVLAAGPREGTPVYLLHGLGATKASWLTIVPALARDHRVYAIDLPGFGASSKPLGRYDAPWFAERVFELMDAQGHGRALVAGNSMGGRIAQEMAMRRPERLNAIACLAPATAFGRRPALWLAKLARPELGVVLPRLPRSYVKDQLKGLFAQAKRPEDPWFDAAIDDFLDVWKDPRARLAFFRAARRIYLDEPYGERGFWTRIKGMSVPSFYIFGKHDLLITARFGLKIGKAVPSARVEIWNDCGHVPQIEHPNRTASKMIEFFAASTRSRKVG